MANRVQEDHKLIVGIEGSRSGDVPNHSPKDSIPGKRGIVYFNADGSSESTSGNTPGVDEDGNKEEGTTQPDAGGSGAGTSGGQYNSGNTTADAGVNDPYPVDDTAQPGSGIFSVDGMTLGDIVKGVTGLKDCATNQPVDVRFDGQFTAPDGWVGPESPPPVPGYESGVYWTNNMDGIKYHTKSAAAQAGVDIAVTGVFTDEICSYVETAANKVWQVYTLLVNGWSCQYIGVTIVRNLCSEAYNSICETTPELTEWPADKPMQLSYNSETGQYETHSMDGNVTPEYSQPVSSFHLCTESGDPLDSYAQADGGQALYNATTGIATFLDSAGKVVGYGDAQAITNRQPR